MIIDYFKAKSTPTAILADLPDEILKSNSVVRLNRSDFETAFAGSSSVSVTVLDSVPDHSVCGGDILIFEIDHDTTLERFESMFNTITQTEEELLMGIYTSDRPGIRCAVIRVQRGAA